MKIKDINTKRNIYIIYFDDCDKDNDVPRTYVIDDIEKCNDKKLLEKEVEEIVDYDDCLEVWVM